VRKAILLRQKPEQIHYYYRIATKLAKAHQYLLLQLQLNIKQRKKLCCKKSLT